MTHALCASGAARRALAALPRGVLVASSLCAACTQGAQHGADDATEPGIEGTANPTGGIESAVTAPDMAARLPVGWSGEGTLAANTELPPGAPAWAAVRAEIRSVEGARFLFASVCVTGIRTPALAFSTAQNRARAEMTRWLGTERLVGSELDVQWQPEAPTSDAAVCSRMKIPVPPAWQPGQALPADALSPPGASP